MAEGWFIATCQRCGKEGLVWKRTKYGNFILSEKGVQKHICTKKNLEKMKEIRKLSKMITVKIQKCPLCGETIGEIPDEKNIIVKYVYKCCDNCC